MDELFSDESLHSFESDDSKINLEHHHDDENIFKQSKEDHDCITFYENVSLCIKDVWHRVEQLDLMAR